MKKEDTGFDSLFVNIVCVENNLKNLDMEKFVSDYDWETGTIEDYNEKLENYNYLSVEDIKEAYDIDELEIIEYSEPEYWSEVVNFKAYIKLKTFTGVYYVKLKVYDDLSPNRYYNLPEESHLDTTRYTVYVEGEYSRDEL